MSYGRSRAKARGQSLGRPFKLTPHQRQEAVKRRDAGDETLTEIGRSYNVSAQTISRLASYKATRRTALELSGLSQLFCVMLQP